MTPHKSKMSGGQVQASVAIWELIDRYSDYDTSTTAWVEFDCRMTSQLVQLEQQLRRYFTPVACRQDLGR